MLLHLLVSFWHLGFLELFTSDSKQTWLQKKLCFCRPLSSGQRGEVYEVNGNEVAVVLDVGETNADGEKDEKLTSQATRPSICWINDMCIELITIVTFDDC